MGIAGVLRAEPLWVETFTGLRVAAFGRLLRAVRERGGEGTNLGRPWCLPLGERVLLVAVYYRTNLTMRQLAPLFGCSRPQWAGAFSGWVRSAIEPAAASAAV